MRNVSKLVCLLTIAAGSAMAVPQRNDGRGDELPRETSELFAQYPGTQASWINGRIASIWGKPMTEGDTPEAAARNFMALHSGAFGIPNIELTLTGSEDAAHGKFKVFVFKQSMGGVDVEFGYAMVTVLVDRPDGGRPVVVSVGSRLAHGDVTDIAADRLSGENAVAFARNIAEWKHLPVWSKPELVVFYGEGDLPNLITPVRAWKFVGEQPQIGYDGETREKYTFFVDAAGTGLKAVRDEVIHADVTGQVQVWATPGSAADHAGNPPVLMAFPWLEVAIGGTTANTNATGNFVLANPGTTPVTVQTTLAAANGGMWAYIGNTNGTGAALTASQLVTPPGPANLVMNPVPSEFLTAQVNTILAANASHNFIKDRAPTFTNLDSAITTNVNINSSCNAFYDGTSINFYRAAGTCNNTGFSSVAAHEYGHHIVNQHNPQLQQNSFGEGFGDCVGMLLYNDPVLGRFFSTSGGAVRSPDTANIPVPCTGSQEVHNCGMQLPGVWWEIKKAFDIKYGAAAGLARTQQLFVDWYIVTTGGISQFQAIGPTTAIEILTVNDTDGDLNNGTPDYNEIRNAFCAHNVQSPVLNIATISFPSGVPTMLSPAASGTPVSFEVASGNATVIPNTGRIFYRTAGTPIFSTAVGVETSPNHYTATIPAQACGSTIEFYYQVGTSSGNVTNPASSCGGASATYSAIVAYGINTVFSDAFETNLGWTFGAAGDTATTGQWQRAIPLLTAAQPGSDHTEGAGTICAITGAAAGAVGDNDVDGGYTTLVSPTMNLAGRTNAYVSYWRWYNNVAGASPAIDTMRVEISNDNGATWTNFETVGPATQNSGGWLNKTARLDSGGLPTLTSQMKMRFIADDALPGSIVEAAIDDFLIYQLDCTSPCAADFNEDGALDFFDYLDFVDAFSANSASADFNADSVIDFFDYLDFVDAFSAGC